MVPGEGRRGDEDSISGFPLVLPGSVSPALPELGDLCRGSRGCLQSAKPKSPPASLKAGRGSAAAVLPGESNAELNIWIIPKFLQQ